MTQQNNEAFEKWFESELQKLIDVKNYDDMHMLQINKHLAWKAWQAATQHSEREIAELQDAINLHKATIEFQVGEYKKLQASNNKLREALGEVVNRTESFGIESIAQKALASTPAQSLAERKEQWEARLMAECTDPNQ